ncbi:hypothetical protein F4861DRAFT_526013 [Xylaria intraflava]|nr:hypothetical protein F4861DRAFT_526013 [Xylaria intraflava]
MASDDVEFPESDDEEEWYDEDAIYQATPENLLSGPARSDLLLYEKRQEVRGGATRTQRKGTEFGALIYGNETAVYDLSVERLVCVDGWRETTVDGGKMRRGQEMTLMVVNFVFAAKDPSSKVAFASAEFRFKSDKKEGQDPEVVAWGPFRRRETWNASAAQRRVNFGAKGGINVNPISLGLSGENETAWERVDFDSGQSEKLFNLTKPRPTPNGIRWSLKQNKLRRQGVTPEFRVAVLLSRSSSDPYLVDFRLKVHTGKVVEMEDRFLSRVGLPGGKSHFWRVTPRPGSKENCYAQGLQIIRTVDIENLGKLQSDPDDVENLNPSWLNAWDRFETPSVKADREVLGTGAGMNAQMGSIVGAAGDLQPVVGNARPLIPATEAPLGASPGLLAQETSLFPSNHGRLVSLETRAALSEARIAAQDQLILNLQRTIIKMEQALDMITKGP